jgi:hypothetical protein
MFQSFTCCNAGPLSVFILIIFYAMPWQTGGIFAPACWDAVLGQEKFQSRVLSQPGALRRAALEPGAEPA